MRRRAALFAISISACGETKHAPDAAPPSLLPRLDLAGVVGFAIGSAPTGDTCPSTLYALRANGELVAAPLTAPASCVASTPEQATAIFDTKQYVVIAYAASAGSPLVGSPTCSLIVVRKSDGSLQCAPSPTDVPARVVGNGDALFLGATGTTTAGISRLDMTTTPPTLSVVYDATTSMDRIDAFDANNANDVLVAGSFGARVVKAAGGTTMVNGNMEACQWYDASTDAFYVGTARLKTSLRPARLVIEKLDASYTPVLAGEITSTSNTPPSCKLALPSGDVAYGWINAPSPSLIQLASPTAGACWQSTGTPTGSCTMDATCNGQCLGGGSCLGGVCCSGGSHDGDPCMNGDADCVGTCAKAGTERTLSGLASITVARGHGTNVFIQAVSSINPGKDTLLAVPPTGATQATLLQDGDYTLTATSLATNGELSWFGQRTSDGANVVGTCSATACVAANTAAPALTALQRID